MNEKCQCSLCDPVKHAKANDIAQEVLIKQRTAIDDETNAMGFILAAAALAKQNGISTIIFATTAAKAFNSIELISKDEMN